MIDRPIHVRPMPDKCGVESHDRGPLIGCVLVVTDPPAEVAVQRYATEDARRVGPVDLSNALITLEYLTVAR